MAESAALIRVLIVDDEQPARELIRQLLKSEADVEVQGECARGAEAVRALRQQKADLVFLDIELPDFDGFEVLRRVGVERAPCVVFVTAYDQYAIRAFAEHALDYLLKPFAKARFRESLERARQEIRRAAGERPSARLEALLAAGAEHQTSSPYLDRLMVKLGARLYYIDVADIDRIESADHYLQVYVKGKAHTVPGSISRMEEQLAPERFARIHRTVIINTERVERVQNEGRGSFSVLLADGSKHRLSRGRKELLGTLLPKET